MAGSFQRRARELEEAVGDGNLVMGAVVSQPYAAAEHNRAYYKHPRGGISGYLEIPFEERREEMMQKIARHAVVESGSNLDTVSKELAAEFEDMVKSNAPVEFNVLRNSVMYYVIDNGIETLRKPGAAGYNYDKE